MSKSGKPGPGGPGDEFRTISEKPGRGIYHLTAIRALISSVTVCAIGPRSSTLELMLEWLCLQNPNDKDAKVKITYMLGTGENRTQEVVVKANSRYTVGVNDFLGPDQDVSCKVTSDRRIVAERPIYFKTRENWDGGHNVMGAQGAKTRWYFAEGTTRGNFTEWLCLQNPGSKDAGVTINYMLATGQNIEKKYTVKAKSRYTVDVKLEIGADQDVSAEVTSNRGIIAERPMYFNYNGVWTGGHNVIGYSP